MAQAQVNASLRDGFRSLQWNPKDCNIKCELNRFCSIKVEKKKDNVFIVMQEATSPRIKLTMDTFENLCELKESILFLMSFVDVNSPETQ